MSSTKSSSTLNATKNSKNTHHSQRNAQVSGAILFNKNQTFFEKTIDETKTA